MMNRAKIYEINYKRLATLLLPTFLRQPRVLSFLRAFGLATEVAYNRFMVGRRLDLFREGIDCSIPRLEYMLNSVFYPDGLDVAYNHRIIIEGIKGKHVLRIFLGGIVGEVDEGRPCYLNPTQYLYVNSEAGEIFADFVVKVPSAVAFDEIRMKTMIGSYALPGMYFEIVKY
jgi:hypothetical protein